MNNGNGGPFAVTDEERVALRTVIDLLRRLLAASDVERTHLGDDLDESIPEELHRLRPQR